MATHCGSKATRSLKVGLKLCVGNTSVALTGVLLVDGLELDVRAGLFSENGTGDRDDLFFTVFGVTEEGRAPGVATNGAACDEDGSCRKLARQVVKKVV